MMTKHGMKAGVVMEFLLILAGLGLLTKAGMISATTYKFMHAAQSAEGTISGIGSHNFGLNVQFSTPQEGLVFRQDGLFFNRTMGQQVPVLYDAEHPQIAAVNEPLALWFHSLVLGLPGLVLFMWGFRMRGRRSV